MVKIIWTINVTTIVVHYIMSPSFLFPLSSTTVVVSSELVRHTTTLTTTSSPTTTLLLQRRPLHQCKKQHGLSLVAAQQHILGGATTRAMEAQ